MTVRSAASIATSVPEPMAMPRSACASAAASLTPSPTMATVAPAACSFRTASTLPSGQDARKDVVRADPDGGRHLRGHGGVVAGQQDRPEPELPEPGDRRGGAGLEGVAAG